MSHDTHAHAGLKPFLIDSFAGGFKLVRMHLWVKEISSEAILEALRKGRGYIGFDGFSPTAPMFFGIQTSTNNWAVPGDSVAEDEAKSIVVRLPRKATVAIYRNGEKIHETTTRQSEWPIQKAGVYRLEAGLKNKPWIITNPIYCTAVPFPGVPGSSGNLALPETVPLASSQRVKLE